MRWWVLVINAMPVASFIYGRQGHFVRQRIPPLHMSIPNGFDTLTSGLASICRIQYGVTVSDDVLSTLPGESAGRPRLAQLYDIENNVQCRAVRERITELDLVVERVIPAAPNSRVFKDESYEFALPASIKASVPRLVVVEDGGEEQVLAGKEDILSFLNARFASRIDESTAESEDLKDRVFKAIGDVGIYLAGALRFGRGTTVCSAAEDKTTASVPRPSKPLILYSYEGNQFCRLVREVLTELDLVYELRSAGKLSPRREELSAITGGSSQCPFLIDDNTNTKMAESADIICYLYKNYALWTPPNELLQAASNVVLPLLKPVFSVLTPLQAGSYREDNAAYEAEISKAKAQIESEVAQEAVVVYTYELSPFSTECKELLSNLGITFKEVSLGMEWLPGLISDPSKRAALFEMTGQSSLPHAFIGGKSIGGLFSGSPGLVPALEEGTLLDRVERAKSATVGAFE